MADMKNVVRAAHYALLALRDDGVLLDNLPDLLAAAFPSPSDYHDMVRKLVTRAGMDKDIATDFMDNQMTAQEVLDEFEPSVIAEYLANHTHGLAMMFRKCHNEDIADLVVKDHIAESVISQMGTQDLAYCLLRHVEMEDLLPLLSSPDKTRIRIHADGSVNIRNLKISVLNIGASHVEIEKD